MEFKEADCNVRDIGLEADLLLNSKGRKLASWPRGIAGLDVRWPRRNLGAWSM
ncbi:hypothetical protein NDS46_12615 [Paenibacillus thiaminolyticus]|uniref:hypothetical protein n=1 Tax=Paenibacillus thiaminolyticus TaxID=49283 RepID=UPI00232ED284|nr:hypothetical protein [Paenibacillus thiaminolyticus]WCF10628.1 hypothetical protein NDS46_12615 [Paenibacillus thiaminolyticus]